MAKLDKRRVQMIDDLNNVFWKFIFSGVVIAAFVYVLIKLLQPQTEFDSYKLGAIELFLTGTLYVVFKHYFPVKEAAEKREKAPAE